MSTLINDSFIITIMIDNGDISSNELTDKNNNHSHIANCVIITIWYSK